jgi:hypothetical protein
MGETIRWVRKIGEEIMAGKNKKEKGNKNRKGFLRY